MLLFRQHCYSGHVINLWFSCYEVSISACTSMVDDHNIVSYLRRDWPEFCNICKWWRQARPLQLSPGKSRKRLGNHVHQYASTPHSTAVPYWSSTVRLHICHARLSAPWHAIAMLVNELCLNDGSKISHVSISSHLTPLHLDSLFICKKRHTSFFSLRNRVTRIHINILSYFSYHSDVEVQWSSSFHHSWSVYEYGYKTYIHIRPENVTSTSNRLRSAQQCPWRVKVLH